MSGSRRHRVGSWPLFVIAVPAGVAVWSGWVGLGQLTGFGVVHPLPGIADDFTINSAITLPIGVETYAAYAMRVWFAGSGIPRAARRYAAVSAIASLLVGIAGQVAYHLMEAAGVTKAPWAITMAVACLPVVTFGMAMALAHLLNSDDEPASGEAIATNVEPVATAEVTAVATMATPTVEGEATTAVEPVVKPVTEATGAVVEPLSPPVVAAVATMADTDADDSAFGLLSPESRHGEGKSHRLRRSSGNAALVRGTAAANPDASIARLATLTGLSRSTVRKYLPEATGEDTTGVDTGEVDTPATGDVSTDGGGEMAPGPANGHDVPELLAAV